MSEVSRRAISVERPSRAFYGKGESIMVQEVRMLNSWITLVPAIRITIHERNRRHLKRRN